MPVDCGRERQRLIRGDNASRLLAGKTTNYLGGNASRLQAGKTTNYYGIGGTASRLEAEKKRLLGG